MIKNNNKMMISNRMGSTWGSWSALDAIPKVKEVEHQTGSG